MSPARAGIMWLGFLGCIGALSYAVYATMPDYPVFPKEYEGGLDRELGGMGAVRVSPARTLMIIGLTSRRHSRRVTRWRQRRRSLRCDQYSFLPCRAEPEREILACFLAPVPGMRTTKDEVLDQVLFPCCIPEPPRQYSLQKLCLRAHIDMIHRQRPKDSDF
jgi:hypothetical protein